MKAAQDLDGICNCLWSEQPRAENAVPKAGDLAIFMNFAQAASGKTRDF